MSNQERHLDQKEVTRGRQAAVGALIGQEHYPRIRRLQTHYDWLRKLSEESGYKKKKKNYPKIGLRTNLLTQTSDICSVGQVVRKRIPLDFNNREQLCFSN